MKKEIQWQEEITSQNQKEFYERIFNYICREDVGIFEKYRAMYL